MKPLALAPALLLATWFMSPWTILGESPTPQLRDGQTAAVLALQTMGRVAPHDDTYDTLDKRGRVPPTLTAAAALAAPLATPIPAPPPQPVTLEGAEAVICAQDWPCQQALSVARCESGPDYIAGFNRSWHGGTFQIASLHAWRFTKRGWDFWTDALVLERNVAIAYEIWAQQGWRPWSCRPR